MKNFTSVNYSDLMPPDFSTQLPEKAEFAMLNSIHCGWGRLHVNQLSLGEISLVKFEGQVNQNLHLRNRDVNESGTVDSCIFLEGTVDSDFAGLESRMQMRKGMQNFIYKPETTDDHYLPAQERIDLLHISVDRFYYAALLSESEKWSADLKERLLNKKLICGSMKNMQMSRQMVQIVNDLLNCPLKGNLRSLIIESRVIEFIALQLNQMVRQDPPAPTSQKLKSSDRDALHALRAFLQETFTKDHSLRNLALSFGLNEFKLKKGFKELFGTTVFDYLHDLKMEYARQLLEADEVLVNEVSGIVGYRNPNHFSTAFKRKYGVNPTRIRK